MKANLVAIKDCVVKAKTWNPVVEAKDETITYIDIAAVDKDLKKIVEPTLCLGAEAPSRARQLVQTNDVLVSTVRPNLNSVAVVTEEFSGATASTGYTVLRPLPEVLDTQYLFHWVKTGHFINEMIKLATGQSYPAVSDKIILNSKIPLPPLAEQRRIAAILDQADELRQKRQQAIEKLDQLLQATFIDMFGDPIDNLKGLETVALLDLCKKITDGTHQSPKWTTEGIPFLFISNIVDGEIDYSSQKFIDQVTYDSLTKSTKIELNDILYTTVGSYGNVARVKSDQLFCFQRHIAHIKPSFDKVNPKFLEKMLSSYGVRRQADRLVRGVAQKTLNLKDLKEIIVFNISLDEQNYFVQKCEVIESLKIKSKLALNQADDLFKSLQNQAFNGTLFENLRYKDSYEI